jgi:phosphoribosylformimino-5-aminoimidazole carboxamide ribotide isomerase
MLRIIPAIDLRGGRCVRLQQGDYNRQTTYDASPLQMAQFWESQGAELIHLVDLDGAKSGAPAHLELIGRLTRSIKTPCELGGGVREPRDVWACLNAGVTRVILGSAIVENPMMISQLLADLDAEWLVAGLDVRDGRVAIHGWLETSAAEPLEVARELTDQGIRQLIYTDISTDGMFTGPNLDAVRRLCEACPTVSIVASGGIGTPEHVRQLARLGLPNLVGVIVGKALYDQRVTFGALVAAARSA